VVAEFLTLTGAMAEENEFGPHLTVPKVDDLLVAVVVR
jgi:hypothetical protein